MAERQLWAQIDRRPASQAGSASSRATTRSQSRQVSCFSSKSAQGRFMMGSEGEAFQSFLRTVGQCVSAWIDVQAPLGNCLPTRPCTGPLTAQAARMLCAGSGGRRLPAILGAIDPHPVQDCAQASCHGNHGPRRSPALGDCYAPDLQGRASGPVPQDDASRLDQGPSDPRIAALGDAAASIEFAGLIAGWHQAKVCRDGA